MVNKYSREELVPARQKRNQCSKRIERITRKRIIAEKPAWLAK